MAEAANILATPDSRDPIARMRVYQLAVELLEGKFHEGDAIEVDEKKGRLVFRKLESSSKKSPK